MQKNISFKDTDGLGNVVKSIKPFCKLTKKMTTITPEYIIGDFNNPQMHGLAGHKWSRLCGFTFETSKSGTPYSKFQFVYVPKLRGTITRNDKALSGWYCWEVVATDHRNVRSIDYMKNKYGFDVTAFVHCDEFNKYIPIFISNINAALNGPVQNLLDSTTDASEKQELTFYVNAIKTSINEIWQVQKVIAYDGGEKILVDPDDPQGKANLAYNADKNYGLRNLDKDAQKELELKRNKLKAALKGIKPIQSKDTIPDNKDDIDHIEKSNKIKFDPSLKYKFGGGRTKKSDAEIFDKYDDYDNDDYQ